MNWNILFAIFGGLLIGMVIGHSLRMLDQAAFIRSLQETIAQQDQTIVKLTTTLASANEVIDKLEGMKGMLIQSLGERDEYIQEVAGVMNGLLNIPLEKGSLKGEEEA
jgi:uncharacterized coiled-coil protein SlyX